MTRNETAGYLLARDRVAIVTHCRPDGDTIGSAASLCLGLRQLGKSAWVLDNPEVTEKYVSLLSGLTKAWPEDGDLVVCVDVASSNMLPAAFRELEEKIALRIDHHGTAMPFTPEALVDPATASCGEIVYDVLLEMGVKLDQRLAEALYTAVSTDTGCFRYANTTANTLRTAADCKEAGADTFALNQIYFETNSLGRLRLQGWLVENARFLRNGRAVICALPRATEEELGLTEDDMENISGFPRTIAGVKMAVTIRENGDGTVKASIRSVPGYDAAAVCAKFGGGGHKGAAGVTMHMTLEEAAEALAAALPEIEI